jgi:hypothetical protein
MSKAKQRDRAPKPLAIDPHREDCCGRPMYRDGSGTFSDGTPWTRYRCMTCGRRYRWTAVPRWPRASL